MILFPLTAEAVKGATLSLEGIDDVQAGDGLALGVFGVGDGVADDALEEGLEHATGLFVDHCIVWCMISFFALCRDHLEGGRGKRTWEMKKAEGRGRRAYWQKYA